MWLTSKGESELNTSHYMLKVCILLLICNCTTRQACERGKRTLVPSLLAASGMIVTPKCLWHHNTIMTSSDQLLWNHLWRHKAVMDRKVWRAEFHPQPSNIVSSTIGKPICGLPCFHTYAYYVRCIWFIQFHTKYCIFVVYEIEYAILWWSTLFLSI